MIFLYPIINYEVIDGDSIKAVIDLGFDMTKKITIRLFGVDTPELRTSNKREKHVGFMVKNVVKYWMECCVNPMFWSVKKDKFSGRGVGHIVSGEDVNSKGLKNTLSSYILNMALGYSYEGGKKREWTEDALSTVAARAKLLLLSTPEGQKEAMDVITKPLRELR